MLFDLTKEQISLTSALADIIKDQIQDTYIEFSQYMQLALYHPQYGYYSNLLHKFGPHGDYVTAPLVSELFAVGLSRQIEEIFQRGVTRHILEFGAGNGQLMLDILANSDITHYYIVEISASLVTLQQQRLFRELPEFQDRVTWLSALPQNFSGVIIGNEILDSIPCDIVRWHNGKIYSKVVSFNDNKFCFSDVVANTQTQEFVKNIQQTENDYVSEISFMRNGFIKSLGALLDQGVILLIDYGYGAAEYYSPSRAQGTLRGFFRHHLLDNVLIYPGLIDITSSVDFTAVAQVAISNNLDLLGFTTQSAFLINCDIISELEKKKAQCTDGKYLQLTNRLNQLISPNEMGEIVKVMALGKNVNHVDYIGFSSQERGHTL